MKNNIYLDYNELLKFNFNIVNDEITYDIECNSTHDSLKKIVVDNINKISSMEYLEDKDLFKYSLNNNIFIYINKSDGSVQQVNKLTSFETRLLAQGKQKHVPFNRNIDNIYIPRTDLHTHFAGAIRPDALIEVGLKHDILYPLDYLKKMGIDTSKYEVYDNQVKLRDLSSSDLNIMKSKFRLPVITSEIFNKMEDIYMLRGPFTKNKELFVDLLYSLADDYKRNGVEYVELSFSSFLQDPEYMKMIEENVPKIFDKTGVRLRFLAGFWRHSNTEWNLDDIDRLKSIARSPYVVGCDFMGHETNSTDDFKKELEVLTDYVINEDPEFVIRVHAGENPMYKDNIKKALKIIYDEYKYQKESTGKDFKIPNVRIGHGLYGVDDETLELAMNMDAVIEFNLSSNLALNNIENLSQIPIKKYLDYGIDVVLGTDGHGLYSTCAKHEAILASAVGLNIRDMKRLARTEIKVLENALSREIKHAVNYDVMDLYNNIKFETVDGIPRWNDEVSALYALEDKKSLDRLKSLMVKVGAVTDEEQINLDIEGKKPVVITGSSEASWKNIEEEDQKYIELLMQTLANSLNPDKSFVVTGGTNFGVEKRMHEAVHRRNLHSNKKMVLLGTLVQEAVKSLNDEVSSNTITHATILKLDGHYAKHWSDLPDTQLELLNNRDGELIAVGGGTTVNDMIQRAHNLGISMNLMNGPSGASTINSESLKGNHYDFVTIRELLSNMYMRNKEMFNPEFSMDNINNYINNAQYMIVEDKKKKEVIDDLKNISNLDYNNKLRYINSKVMEASRNGDDIKANCYKNILYNISEYSGVVESNKKGNSY